MKQTNFRSSDIYTSKTNIQTPLISSNMNNKYSYLQLQSTPKSSTSQQMLFQIPRFPNTTTNNDKTTNTYRLIAEVKDLVNKYDPNNIYQPSSRLKVNNSNNNINNNKDIVNADNLQSNNVGNRNSQFSKRNIIESLFKSKRDKNDQQYQEPNSLVSQSIKALPQKQTSQTPKGARKDTNDELTIKSKFDYLSTISKSLQKLLVQNEYTSNKPIYNNNSNKSLQNLGKFMNKNEQNIYDQKPGYYQQVTAKHESYLTNNLNEIVTNNKNSNNNSSSNIQNQRPQTRSNNKKILIKLDEKNLQKEEENQEKNQKNQKNKLLDIVTQINQGENIFKQNSLDKIDSTTNKISKDIKDQLKNSQIQTKITKKIQISSKNTEVNTNNNNSNDIVSKYEKNEEIVPVNNITYYITSLEKAYKNRNDNEYFNNLFREHFVQILNSLSFLKNLKPIDNRTVATKRVYLNKHEKYKDKKTVIFDLDETLIHCNESADKNSDAIISIKFPHGEIINIGINIRPYALDMLREMSQLYEIIVFTASHKCYADQVLDYLDQKNQYISHRLYRDSCIQTSEGIYIKDLRIFGNRSISDMVLVDNAAYSFGQQIDNGIPILPFYYNKLDKELLHLTNYLKSLANYKDFREINKKTFKLYTYNGYDNLDKFLDKVINTK